MSPRSTHVAPGEGPPSSLKRVISHCQYTHFVYPLYHQQTLGLLPPLCNCEWRCHIKYGACLQVFINTAKLYGRSSWCKELWLFHGEWRIPLDILYDFHLLARPECATSECTGKKSHIGKKTNNCYLPRVGLGWGSVPCPPLSPWAPTPSMEARTTCGNGSPPHLSWRGAGPQPLQSPCSPGRGAPTTLMAVPWGADPTS